MRVNQDVQSNTFNKGMAIDPSDMVMPADTMRFAQNVRIVNHQSSSYVITNLQGTDEAFTLTSGYQMIASQEYANVLYIISYNSSNGYVELGTYPSPVYSGGGGNNVYRPLRNFEGFNDFRTNLFGTTAGNTPVIQKLEIQQDYDNSVNFCFTIKGLKPRIVNSKFDAYSLAILPARTGASSNTYVTASVATETLLIPATSKIMKTNFVGIETGGALKPGNYQYVFYYMNDSFNRTSIIDQSSICQIFFGETIDNIRGGDETEVTNKKVHLQLTNVDSTFKYLKVYVLYSSGQDSLTQQYLEFIQPIEIPTGVSTVEFYHTGFEEVSEVSQDEINIDYASILSASAATQVGGYLFLGDVKQKDIEYTTLRTAVAAVQPTLAKKSFNVSFSTIPLYCDPSNTYNYLGYMAGETYAFAIVFIMKDGSLSPAFPISSKNKAGAVSNDGKGLVTFKYNNNTVLTGDGTTNSFWDGTLGYVKHITLDLASLKNNTTITDATAGFFIVRADRRPNATTQGVLIPTIKAPSIEATDGDPANQSGYGADTSVTSINAGGYYLKNGADWNDYSKFKHLICLDSIIEGFLFNRDGTSNDKYVVDSDNNVLNGYMPLSMAYNTVTYDNGSTAPRIYLSDNTYAFPRHWALISGEALVNEPEYVSSLQRDGGLLQQFGRLDTYVTGSAVSPTLNAMSFGAHYRASGINQSTFLTSVPESDVNLLATIKNTVYVPAASIATGTNFISKIKVALVKYFGTSTTMHYWVNQIYNSYFGIEIQGSSGALNKGTISTSGSTDYPISPNRYSAYNIGVDVNDTINNLNTTVPVGFMVNIYSQGAIYSPSDLYPSVDNLTYKQITKRYSWSDLTSSTVVDVFGGDCYVSRVSRKINQSPEKDPSILPTSNGKRWNIDSGLILTWWQESKYNLHLRQPKQVDASEYEKRSFFPYKTLGDVTEYRKNRLLETTSHSLGYSQLLAPKSFYPISTTIPSEKSSFMTRIYHSERHIQNAFRNGYRSFLENNYKDYDTSMGPIIAMFNHRGNLLVVFKNGIAIGGINQRIETGKDGAGSIFVEPTTVLPPILTYLSREIGCQDNLAIVQTPGAVYGMDQAKKKIWCVQDGLRVISDEAQVSTWLNLHPPDFYPTCGYDITNNEVIFKCQDWTLCYSEIVQRFTSFYNFNTVTSFARLGNNFYGFVNEQAYKHNSQTAGNYVLHDQLIATSFVEFVINKGATMAKIMDYFNVVSNEVAPDKIEVYTYNQDSDLEFTIIPTYKSQYGVVENQYDEFLQTSPIVYRDRRYVVHSPLRSIFNSGTNVQYADWDIEGRIRDKAIIVRLTYNFDDTKNKPLELASVLSYFRYSRS